MSHTMPLFLDKHSSQDLPPIQLDDLVLVPGKTLFPLSAYVSDAIFSDHHQVFLAAVSAGEEPAYFKDDVLIKDWNDVMVHEIVALEDNVTRTLEDLPKEKSIMKQMDL